MAARWWKQCWCVAVNRWDQPLTAGNYEWACCCWAWFFFFFKLSSGLHKQKYYPPDWAFEKASFVKACSFSVQQGTTIITDFWGALIFAFISVISFKHLVECYLLLIDKIVKRILTFKKDYLNVLYFTEFWFCLSLSLCVQPASQFSSSLFPCLHSHGSICPLSVLLHTLLTSDERDCKENALTHSQIFWPVCFRLILIM